MNGNDVFRGMQYLSAKYIDQAEFGEFSPEAFYHAQETGVSVKRRKARRALLLAAAIGALLLLAGCVAAILRLQDLSIGKETYTQRFDSQGQYMEPVEKTKDILTLTGYAAAPEQLAAKEWLAFQESYDPNGELLTNEPNLADIPDAEEAVYGCYTPGMVEKLHEIAGKYDLKLLDVYTVIQRYQSEIGLKALGVTTLLKEGAQARMGEVSGPLYPPYNFKLEYYVNMEAGSLWTEDLLVTECYHRSGYFPRNAFGSYDLSEFTQWDHMTQDGTKLLLALSSKGHAMILADLGHGFLSIEFNSYTGTSLYPQPEEIISREGLEQVAEVFNYQLPFAEIDCNAIQPALDAAEEAHRASHPPYVPQSYPDFDSYMEKAGVWMGPEGFDYCVYDWNEDGAEELLIGYNGMVNRILAIENGEGTEMFRISSYLCTGGVWHEIEQHDFSSFARHVFYGGSGPILTMTHYQGNWYKTEEPVDLAALKTLPALTEAEAQAVLAQYPHVDLPWQPVLDYTFADGGTVAQRIPKPEKLPPLTGEALRQAYADVLRESSLWSYYALSDLDGDGEAELLVSDNDKAVLGAYSGATGKAEEMDIGRGGDGFYPCENGIMEGTQRYGEESGVEIEQHLFYQVNQKGAVLVDYAFYNKATASWQSDLDGTPMEESTAKAILAKYPRVPLDLRPVGELVG